MEKGAWLIEARDCQVFSLKGEWFGILKRAWYAGGGRENSAILVQFYCIIVKLQPYQTTPNPIRSHTTQSIERLTTFIDISMHNNYQNTMEDAKFPSLEKTTSVGTKIPPQSHSQDKENSRYKVGSLPQLPQPNTSYSVTKLNLVRKFSCFSQYRDHNAQSSEQRKELYQKIYELVHQIIENPSKIALLLSALHSMQHSVKSLKRSKGSQDSKGSEGININISGKASTHSLETPNDSHHSAMAHSLQLSCEKEEITTFQASREICDFVAESVEVEYPYMDTMIGDKMSVTESEELRCSALSGVKSIEEELNSSIKIPELTEVYKRMSMLLIDEEESKSQLFSSNASGASLSHIDLPHLNLNIDLITSFFSQASPFLINFTLSLLFKFLLKSKFTLNPGNIGWILGIASLVGYKIYYDQTLEGILEYFSEVLGLKSQEVAEMERWFLRELNYEVLIDSKQYTEIMMRLLKNQ